MSLHKEQTEREVDGLLAHRLPVGKPSQLSDSFILGMRFEQSLNDSMIKEIHEKCEFSIGKLLKHNEVSSHDKEMMRQLLEYIKGKGE